MHHYFLSLEEAVAVLGSWKEEYNNDRPHGSLGQKTPAEFWAGWCSKNDPARLGKVS